MEGFGKYIFRCIVEIRVICKQLVFDESERIIVVFGKLCIRCKYFVLDDIRDDLFR